MTDNKEPDNAGDKPVRKASSAVNDDAKTYDERQCPSCGKRVKVRTYVRATDRAGLEKYPKHNDRNGFNCVTGGWTMRQASATFGVVESSKENDNENS